MFPDEHVGMEIPRVGVPDDLAARLSMAEQHEYLSRRSLIGRGAAVAALAVAGPTFLPGLAYASGDRVTPTGRHIAFGRNPRTQMRVSWQLPAPVRKPFIRVGPDPNDLGHRIPAEVRALHSEVRGVIAPTDQYYLHGEIGGLRPGAKYYYAVGHEDFDPKHADASFTTAPARYLPHREFTFTAFGDQGVSTAALANDGQVNKQNPAFHLLAGDIAYADPTGAGNPIAGTPDATHDVFDPKVWDAYFGQIEPVAQGVPWMVTTGNHDMEALYANHGYGGQTARWDFPGSGPRSCPGAYSFIYGNVGVISLDANDVSYEIPANLGYTGGDQTRWLKQRLAFLRAQPDVDFVVVFFHHCAYSTTNSHASEGGVRDHWVPLFDRYKVDLVVNGHNHVYERSDALRGNRVTKQVPIGGTAHPETDGTVYATCGGGGRSLYDFPAPDTYEGHEGPHQDVPSYHWAPGKSKVTETVQWSRVRFTGYAFMAVDSEPALPGRRSKLTVRVLTSAGAEIDRFTLEHTAGTRFGVNLGLGGDIGDL
jgi:hypothetical protein